MRPPAFIGGMPGQIQFAQMVMQRHQERTLLYREALEELRENPKAADVPECESELETRTRLCLSVPTAEPVSQPLFKVGRRIALLIGNNQYPDPIPLLETPIADVDEIAAILQEQFGYETRVLHNATKADIVRTINQLAVEVQPQDSVLLFYAGHGYLMDDTNMGFWIPVDAETTTARNWISNTDITRLLQIIPARQLLLVSDSCFSGSLTREQKFTQALPVNDEQLLRQRAVIVFSSGGEEPVSDEGRENHSIFAWHFIQTLHNVNQRTPGFKIYRHVRDGVLDDFPIQEPQYGAVISAGHDLGAEYLFLLNTLDK